VAEAHRKGQEARIKRRLRDEAIAAGVGRREFAEWSYEQLTGESIYVARARKGITPLVPPIEYFVPDNLKANL
jgi:hypothetical protein